MVRLDITKGPEGKKGGQGKSSQNAAHGGENKTQKADGTEIPIQAAHSNVTIQ